MRKWKGFLPMMMAAVLMTACGAKQEDTASVQDNKQETVATQETQTANTDKVDQTAKEERTEGSNDALTEANKILKRCSDKTFYNHDSSGNYIIDFVEYPDWTSGTGRCEQVESNALALAAGNLDNGLESLPEYAPMYEVNDRMELPEVCKGEIKSLVREARDYTGHEISGLTWKDIAYTSIEDAGEFNGYEWCRFEGDSMYELFGEEYVFHIVGYTTFLKGSGLPMWVVAIDTTEDQSMNDRLDDLAKNCANTLLEVPDEVMDYFPYNAG